MTAIDTRVYGDPAACATTAAELGTARTAVSAAADVFTAAPGRIESGMRGDTALAYTAQARGTARNLDELDDRIKAAQTAIAAFGTTLKGVQDEMTTLRTTASGSGLEVTATAIVAPAEPPQDADDATVTAYNTKVQAFNDLIPKADHQRWREKEAHTALLGATEKAKGIGPLQWFLDKAGIIPPDGGDGPKNVMYTLAGLGNLAAWSAVWRGTGTFAAFKPRWPAGTPGGIGGQFRTVSEMSKASRFWTVLTDVEGTSWVAKAGKGAAKAKWGQIGKWAGRAGVVLSFAQGAYDQWDADKDDKSLSTGTKGARAGTLGTTTAAGAWAGATAGAQVGAAIGAFGGPVGAAGGAIVGGIVGGVIGSEVGKKAGQAIIDVAPKIADAAKEKLGEAGSWIKDHNPFPWP